MNSDDLSEILVVNDAGKWLPDARHIRMTSDLTSGKVAKIQCVMYRGLFAPPNPKVQTWDLAGIINADASEFAKILSDLQNGDYNTGS